MILLESGMVIRFRVARLAGNIRVSQLARVARENYGMPLTGEYAPSTSDWARKQAELFESTNGQQGGEMRGMKIVVVTSVGAKSGK